MSFRPRARQSGVEYYSTASMSSTAGSRGEKLDFWNDCISHKFTHMESVPDQNIPFEANLKCKTQYGLSFANAVSTASSVYHRRSHIRGSTERIFLVHLQRKGTSVNIQGDNVAFLKPGDFTICDSASPYEVTFKQDSDMLVACVPEKLILNRIPNFRALTAIRICGRSDVGGLASKMLQAVWENDCSSSNLLVEQTISSNLLDLIATAFAGKTQVNRESISQTRKHQVMEFVTRNLQNSELSPASIAEASNISTRYLHKLFQAHGTTVNGWIIQERLALAAEMLKKSKHETISISEIAYSTGFKDLSHFSNRFRKCYGVSPRTYRFE